MLLRAKYAAYGLVIAMAMVVSGCEAKTYDGHESAQAFIEKMVAEHEFERAELEALFAQVEHKESIIKAMNRPAEAKPWKDYRPILVTEKRIKQGLEFWRENAATLAEAEAEFGVPAEVIVAIIGVETRYGRIMGSFRVIDALSTLAFDYPRRSKFFTQQLEEFLLLTREESFEPLTLKGSYAGAMGYGQFMPGSFRHYAIDFDDDNRRDIWTNKKDAIGSVANYFKKHGWKPGEDVTLSASLAEGADEQLASHWVTKRKHLKPKKTLGELQALGLVPDNLDPTKAYAPDQPATAMRLDGPDGYEYWIGLHNFYVITRYNISALYGMAVYQLAGALKEGSSTLELAQD